MEQLLTIEIFGQLYTFKTDSQDQTARAVADFLECEITRSEMQQSDLTKQTNKFAILLSAAMNIAYNHIELKKQYSDLTNDLSFRTTKLLKRLDHLP
ncbi:MAG: cell division protein ZapA [Desulfobacterales bacterium]|nr:cell division protein ZapA [Desulfobacterales bacterium]MDD4073758.1 cell division protein ZapA [Desulfobacterales bacterium]MDD4393935.1 cell division protein ZapA [Desulfobacterales bacterium]